MRSISKIALVGAVASACGYATAATLTGQTVTPYSLESASMTVSGTTVVYTGLAANSVAGVAPRLAIETAAVASGQRLTLSSSRVFGSVDAHTQTFVCSNAGASIIFTIASGASSSSQIVYDVASGSTQNNSSGASCLIPSIAFTAGSLASAGDVTLSGLITVVNGGATLDSFTAAKVASVNNEFAVSTTNGTLDAVIDVASGRLTFASGVAVAIGTTGVADTLTVSSTKTAKTTIGGTYAATFAVVVNASPSFAFLQEPSTVAGSPLDCSASSGSGQATAVAGGVVGSISLSPASGNCTALTANWTTLAPTSYAISLGRSALNQAASVSTAFTPTTFTASYSITNGTLTAQSGSLSAGAWTQNGTTARLQYVPLSSSSTLQVFIANTSNVGGEATFVAYNDAGSTCTGSLGSVTASGVTSVGGTLRSLLLGAATSGNGSGNCSTTFGSAGRAAVTITSTTPSADTRVHSGFSVSDSTSRQIIVNSTN